MGGEDDTARPDLVGHAAVRVNRVGSDEHEVDRPREGGSGRVGHHVRGNAHTPQFARLTSSFPAGKALEDQHPARTSGAGERLERPADGLAATDRQDGSDRWESGSGDPRQARPLLTQLAGTSSGPSPQASEKAWIRGSARHLRPLFGPSEEDAHRGLGAAKVARDLPTGRPQFRGRSLGPTGHGPREMTQRPEGQSRGSRGPVAGDPSELESSRRAEGYPGSG
jgi:hypothetical protein